MTKAVVAVWRINACVFTAAVIDETFVYYAGYNQRISASLKKPTHLTNVDIVRPTTTTTTRQWNIAFAGLARIPCTQNSSDYYTTEPTDWLGRTSPK